MSRLSMNKIDTSVASPLNTECSKYTETLTDFGKVYTVSIHPKHFFFEENATPPDKDSRFPKTLDLQDRVHRHFVIGNKEQSVVEKKHPVRTFDYVEDLNKINYTSNLKKPIYLELFESIINQTETYFLGYHIIVTSKEFNLFNYINYLHLVEDGRFDFFGRDRLSKYKNTVENSKKNRLVLDYNEDKRLFTCEYLDYISVTEFNEGNVYFSFNIAGYAYNQKNKTFFKYLDDRYDLKLRKNGNASFLKNNRLIYTSRGLAEAFYKTIENSWICSPFRDSDDLDKIKSHQKNIFLKLLEKHVLKQDISRFIGAEALRKRDCSIATKLQEKYRVMRNKRLLDLPWNENSLCNLYKVNVVYDREVDYKKFRLARNNISRYLRKGNTKRATEFGYYGFKFPKAIKKLLLTIPPLSLSYTCAKLLFDIYQKFDVNITLNIMKDNAGEVELTYLNEVAYLRALLLGFKKKRLISAGIGCIEDAMRMRQSLIESGVNVEYRTNNFIEYHDYLSRLYTAITKSKSEPHNIAYKIIDTSTQLPSMTVNGFTIRSPKTASELIDVGSDMRHCVASYCRRYYYRNLEILLIEKDNKYVACIEIRDKFVVQAKLKFNAPISQDTKVFNALKEWCEKHGYILNCTDCNVLEDKVIPASELRQAGDTYRRTVVNRLSYIATVLTRRFTLADKNTLKDIIAPTWLAVFDHYCTLNTKGPGLIIWSDKPKSAQPRTSGYPIGQAPDDIPF